MIWKPKIIYYCGGGFKVFSVTGVLPLLKKFGLLDDVHTYAGTSAGGLMAFLCVINYTPEEIFPNNIVDIPNYQSIFIFVGNQGSGKTGLQFERSQESRPADS